jgi:D-alanine-D-alanine ligase
MRITVVSDAGFASIFDRMDGPLTSSHPSVQAQNDAPHVVNAIKELGHDVDAVVLGSHATKALQAFVGEDKPDLVVNLCDSVQGDPALAPLVPAFLDANGIKHTGGDAGATALGKRKHDVKAILSRERLPTPKFQVVPFGDGSDDDAAAFSLHLVPPVILKLCGEHASVGIDGTSVCFDEAAVRAKAGQLQARYRQAILVEEYVGGREFYVSCVGRPLRPWPLMEHELSEALPIRTFDRKWLERDVDSELRRRAHEEVPLRDPATTFTGDLDDVGAVCARALRVLGWRDWGRVDLRLDKGGVPLIIDVTPMTYLHPDSPCAKAAAADGCDYVELWRRILAGASA